MCPGVLGLGREGDSSPHSAPESINYRTYMWLFQYRAVEHQVFETDTSPSGSANNTANPDLT